jgi:hypothetical protein
MGEGPPPSAATPLWLALQLAVITIGVLAVPPVIMTTGWSWQWPEIFFVVSVNSALLVYL